MGQLQERVSIVQHFYDDTAARYEHDIAPVFAPLAADLVAYAAPRSDTFALDIGTGTGIAARMLAPYVRAVVGLDLSCGVLRAARQVPTPTTVHYTCGDIHHAPFATGSFSLIISSFGLNATDPNDSLPIIRRLMKPGGRLVLQEWGPVHPINVIIDEAITEYALDDPSEQIVALREQREQHRPIWQTWGTRLQDTEDYCEWLTELGFTVGDATESAPVAVRISGFEQFLAYRLAWPYNFAEFRAMDAATRSVFDANVRARLAEFIEPDGALIWQPQVIRVTAYV